MKPLLITTAPLKPDATIAKKDLSEKNVYLGYLLLGVSFFLYALAEYVDPEKRGDTFTIFILHYLIALVYIIILIVGNSYGIRKSWLQQNLDKTIILLNLFLISAYALNRRVPVFADSTLWLCVYLIITSLFLLSYRYFSKLPLWVNRLQHLVLGSSLILYFYLTVFVAHIYAIATIGIIFFGIGAHIFTPITLLIGCIFLIRHTHAQRKVSRYWIAAGASITIISVLVFMGEWNSRISKMETMANQSVMDKNIDLPIWVSIAQSIENDWISERILKSDLVYTTYFRYDSWDLFPSRVSWDEIKKHDPLVFISSIVSKCALPDEERIKILEANFANRHQSNERLWSGDNLTTSYIVSDVDIYPELRLAYTEKYLNVRNNNDRERWWGRTQEAIYTFQLPEGSAVTSLSLWIAGKEEKGILTSKQKATTAYKTIVGVEQRDPSVIHWQEGNTVTVRVFPCTPEEERKFKIGITSPLTVKDDEVIFKNVTFRGPTANRAKETYRIRIIGASTDVVMPSHFKKDAKGNYVVEDYYNPDFELSFKAMPFKANQFSFDGFTYSMHPYAPVYAVVDFKDIFLDINTSWKENEIDALKDLLTEYNLKVFIDNEFVTLNAENWRDVTNELSSKNFSLFPFYRINHIQSALVVTKGRALSPHLSDFKESDFAEAISHYFEDGKKIKVYNLGEEISTYVSSLREFRGLEFANGSVAQLNELLKKKTFPKAEESDERVMLHDAKMFITKKQIDNDALGKDNAPDHLARLFAYNNIMRKVGANYFKDNFISDALINEATTAYVVSPISSLIVLETKEDYERFGIEDIDNSLHNASKQSSGAVPEPHEWALIILFVLFVMYLRFRPLRFRPTV